MSRIIHLSERSNCFFHACHVYRGTVVNSYFPPLYPAAYGNGATWASRTLLKPVWNDRSISLSSKIRLMRSLVTFIFLYACESWTLKAELQRRIQAMEMRCHCKILHISYKDHVTNEEVRAKIQHAIRPHEDLLTIVKRCKLQWYGHVSR